MPEIGAGPKLAVVTAPPAASGVPPRRGWRLARLAPVLVALRGTELAETVRQIEQEESSATVVAVELARLADTEHAVAQARTVTTHIDARPPQHPDLGQQPRRRPACAG